MKKLLLILFLPSVSFAGNLISSATWSESGNYKMAQQDYYPGGASSNTISRCWDGTTIKLFGAKGELLKWATYLIGGNSDATNVMVTISSFTGTGAALGSGFSAVAVSSTNVWDYSQRPYSLYKYSYLQMVGMNQVDQAWDPSEYDENQLPPRWRVPCTTNAKNQCIPNNPTYLFTNRSDHDKFYPDPAVPIEEYAISSFTVAHSSSQAIGGEVYVSTSLPAGTYTATLKVFEGASVSTTIPISLLVYNVTLPAKASIPVIANIPLTDPAGRINGNRFPANYFVDPYKTTMLRIGAFLHRHKVSIVGDVPPPTQDYPSTVFQKFVDGSAFTETYGLSANTGPGYNTPQTDYWIGTYGSWQSGNWSTTAISGANGYCTNVSSWTAFCLANNLRCKLYTTNDEADNATLAGIVNKLSTWSSTAPVCAVGGHTLPFLQTADLHDVKTNAPNVNAVTSTAWLGVSSNTWVADEALYQSRSSFTVGGYNSGLGTDSTFAEQEEGLGPREIMWGAKKTNQAFWFLWNGIYWNDVNNPGQGALNATWNGNAQNEDNVLHIAKNFGLDSFPSTDTIRGHFNTASFFSNFANGDGNYLYPGTDSVYTSQSFGFNGVIGSWRLNQLTRGIQDVDLINLAYAVNPSSTTAIINAQVQDVMYLRGCFDTSDCSYYYGPRPWSEVLDSWETQREALLQVAAGAAPPTPPANITNVILKGTIQFQGTMQVQ